MLLCRRSRLLLLLLLLLLRSLLLLLLLRSFCRRCWRGHLIQLLLQLLQLLLQLLRLLEQLLVLLALLVQLLLQRSPLDLVPADVLLELVVLGLVPSDVLLALRELVASCRIVVLQLRDLVLQLRDLVLQLRDLALRSCSRCLHTSSRSRCRPGPLQLLLEHRDLLQRRGVGDGLHQGGDVGSRCGLRQLRSLLLLCSLLLLELLPSRSRRDPPWELLLLLQLDLLLHLLLLLVHGLPHQEAEIWSGRARQCCLRQHVRDVDSIVRRTLASWPAAGSVLVQRALQAALQARDGLGRRARRRRARLVVLVPSPLALRLLPGLLAPGLVGSWFLAHRVG